MSEPEESEIEAAEDAPRKGKAGLREITQKPGFRKFGMGVLFIALVMYGLALYWSQEPKPFDVVEEGAHAAHVENPKEMPLGYTYSTTLIEISHTLLHKPGGFLSNDVFPPSVFLDNIPNWELGALIALRDATTQLRNNIARSQTQSQEDPDLAKGEPFFYFDYRSWQLPSSESEYEKGIESLEAYRERLRKRGANFYARADNLRQLSLIHI